MAKKKKRQAAALKAKAAAKKPQYRNTASVRKAYRYRHIVRFSIEFKTPLHIGSGSEGEMTDAAIVTDANGLAAIPGDSLGGALRENTDLSESEINELFGFQEGDNGNGSRLTISWGAIHNQHNKPQTGILRRSELLNDPVLSSALIPEAREHVLISARGAADRAQRGLYSEDCLAAGHRFSVELELISRDRKEYCLLHQLVAVINSPLFRLGGKTRRGFGACRVISQQGATFDLRNKKQFSAYGSYAASLTQDSPALVPFSLPDNPLPAEHLTIPLQITPAAYWLFGGGVDIAGRQGDADIAPLRTRIISWSDDGTGRVRNDVLVIPAAGIKGPLSHRTAFHYNRLTGIYADEIAADCPNTQVGFERSATLMASHCGVCNPAVQELFGFAKAAQPEDGRRGRVFMDDIFINTEPESQLVNHTPLGRFTGAPVNLFCERPFWQGSWPPLTIFIADAHEIDPLCRQAFVLALEDLAQGRLQLGAGGGRGLGFCAITNLPAKKLHHWVNEE